MVTIITITIIICISAIIITAMVCNTRYKTRNVEHTDTFLNALSREIDIIESTLKQIQNDLHIKKFNKERRTKNEYGV